MNPAFWICGLLFAAVSFLLGMAGFVSAGQADERNLASGMMSQGMLLMFVVAASVHRDSPALGLAGLAIAVVLIIRTVCATNPVDQESSLNETELR